MRETLISAALAVIAFSVTGCGSPAAPTASNATTTTPDPAVNAAAPANAAASGPVTTTIPFAKGPLLGRWARTTPADGSEYVFKADGTYEYIGKNQETGTSRKYAYLGPHTAASIDPQTGETTRTFEFTADADTMTLQWVPGAKPATYTRVGNAE